MKLIANKQKFGKRAVREAAIAKREADWITYVDSLEPLPREDVKPLEETNPELAAKVLEVVKHNAKAKAWYKWEE